MISWSLVVTSTLSGQFPSRRAKRSAPSCKSLTPSLNMMLGFVVTPSTTPCFNQVSICFRSAESTKICMLYPPHWISCVQDPQMNALGFSDFLPSARKFTLELLRKLAVSGYAPGGTDLGFLPRWALRGLCSEGGSYLRPNIPGALRGWENRASQQGSSPPRAAGARKSSGRIHTTSRLLRSSRGKARTHSFRSVG